MFKLPEDRIRARTTHDPATGCIEWVGHITKAGYGRIRVGERSILAPCRNYVSVARLTERVVDGKSRWVCPMCDEEMDAPREVVEVAE